MIRLGKKEEYSHLIERNKELTCLYEIAKIVAQSEKTLPEVLKAVVSALPPAFHYPNNACARIRLDDLTVVTDAFAKSPYKIRERLMIEGRVRGAVEVFYREPHPGEDDPGDHFLPEERKLLKTIARQSAVMIETKLTGEKKIELENQLRHADRLAKIGQLTAGVAHELNEPLAGILGFAELAAKKIDSPDIVLRYLDRIIQSCLHAREIIRKMILFGGPAPPRREKVNVNHLITEGVAFISPRFEKSGIRFRCVLNPALPMIIADPSQITQVIVNLVINAIHAMPEGGDVIITTREADDAVQILVQDTGVGMEPHIVEQIFLPFFTTKDVDKGTGLGLSVVHGIVSSHGGAIAVSSKKGEGATFTLSLPAGRSPDEATH